MNMQMYTQALSGLQQLYEELRHQGVQVGIATRAPRGEGV
jgi:phosphoglycolate phosphatase-like HAD superfamily hydrolase